ncbi:NmrA family NAD(P)-binding protein [Paractinoplanes toevensis]|uniref:NmrA family transcriptional regulator n=1 Tax=Paractinoplanes toevensis TaxID=571911 RepID=A0A919WAT2_9ACTN|nr:NAD(P)H-binding protein [Actinoplanes toevensis]GIM96668.1 NmrA family transcriptional regulator [Actinoplanes toevensis]
MIVVTGATGKLGSQILDLLLTQVPAIELGVSVRDPGAAAHLAARGVRVRAGDFTDPASLASAFEGADQVLLISASIRGTDAAVAANRAAIDAARAAGARRILYTGHQAAAHDSAFAPMLVHAATEDHLAAAGVPFTVLRNGFYVTTLDFYVPRALETGVLALPADGPVSWTAHADLAAAAVAALTAPDLFDGVTPPLTGPAAVDLVEVASILSDVTGRTITRVVVDDEEWKAAAGEFADFTLGMFRAARRGEFAVTDPALEKAIGRPATDVRDFLAGFQHSAAS